MEPGWRWRLSQLSIVVAVAVVGWDGECCGGTWHVSCARRGGLKGGLVTWNVDWDGECCGGTYSHPPANDTLKLRNCIQ
jgi:hypothetical protein